MSVLQRLAVAAIVAAPLVSCSFVLKGDSAQCSVAADCTAKGETFAGAICVAGACQPKPVDPNALPEKWRCLSDPAPTGSGSIKLRFEVTDPSAQSSTSSAGAPVVGLTVRACSRLDFACERPVATILTDAEGVAVVEVPWGFAGYYEVSGSPAYVPALLVLPALYADRLMPVGLATTATIASIYELVGIEQDEKTGLVILGIGDCTSTPAAGVSFDLGLREPSERFFYAPGGLPDPAASRTDDSGGAFLFNARPGQLAVTTSLAGSGTALVSAGASVRAGWLTSLALYPATATPLTSF